MESCEMLHIRWGSAGRQNTQTKGQWVCFAERIYPVIILDASFIVLFPFTSCLFICDVALKCIPVSPVGRYADCI